MLLLILSQLFFRKENILVIKRTVLYTLLGFLLVLIFNISIYSQSYTIKTILTNKTELVPGIGLTTSRISSNNLYVNNKGDIIVTAVLSDGTKGIILYSNGNIKLIVKTVAAQALNEIVFLSVGTPAINDNGEIVFCGNLSGKQGIYKFNDDNFVGLVLSGDSVPGLEGANFDKFNCSGSAILALNNNSEICFNATLSDGRRGLFLLRGKTVQPIAIEGEPFPVVSGEETMVFPDLPVINDKGEIAFRAAYFTDMINERIVEGLFLFREGEFIPVKLPGQEAPGTGGMVYWAGQAGPQSLGNNSEVIHWAFLKEAGKAMEPSTAPTVTGLFLWSNGKTKPLLLEGDAVLGTDSVITGVADSFGNNVINDSGEMVSVFWFKNNLNGIMLFSNDNVVPVVLGKIKSLDDQLLLLCASKITNNGNITFIGHDIGINISKGIDSIFLAIKEDVLFEAIEIEPILGTRNSTLKIKVTGRGFQIGAKVSFSGNAIRILKTEFNTSTTLVVTIHINLNTKPDFYDVIVTNPAGEEAVLKNGFKVVRG